MSFNVAFIMLLFVIYLGFLAGAETYFAQVWLQIVICKDLISYILLVFIYLIFLKVHIHQIVINLTVVVASKLCPRLGGSMHFYK